VGLFFLEWLITPPLLYNIVMLLTAIALTLLVPLTFLGVGFTRWKRPGGMWLLAVLGALTAWVLILMTRPRLPVEITLPAWQIGDLPGAPLSLLLDEISWPFAVAATVLPLAAMLTDVAHLRDQDVQVWASTLALGGVGLIAAVAGTPVTLLLAWTVIDVSDVFVLLRRVEGSAARERVVVSFSSRVAGMLFLVLAMIRVQAAGDVFAFTSIPAESTGYLLVAAGLRLGVFPPRQPHLGAPDQRRGLGTITRLLPAIASLVFVVRIATAGGIAGMRDFWAATLLVLTTVAALYGAWQWYRAGSALQGRSFWLLSLAAFSLITAMQGLVAASMAWGLAALFSGALLFLFAEMERRWMLLFPVLGAVCFSALPLTPAWEGSALFGALGWGYAVAFALALGLLFAGYLRHARRDEGETAPLERWMWLVYPLGLGLLPLTHSGIVYFRWVRGTRAVTFQTAGWWFGLIPLGLAALFLVWSNRQAASAFPLPGAESLTGARQPFNLNFIYRFFWLIYRLVGRFINLLSNLLEGEGGVLWAVLVLILVVVSLNVLSMEGGLDF